MEYEEYVKIQVEEHGQLHKPIHYRIGEYLAIQKMMNPIDRNNSILDVGCGIGDAVGIFAKMGFKSVVGIDINPNKIEVGRSLGYKVHCFDVIGMPSVTDYWNIIWCSHSFEHFLEPAYALYKMKEVTEKDGRFFFVLPYPDLTPANAHVASEEIGLTVDDGGKTLRDWFYDKGLMCVSYRFDDYREPEIWLEFVRV